MANTVNDVMNVIASPDYGIKNIAGTTKEILAILEGTSKSKGNLHSIVDDVKNLLQKLVDASTQKKSIEIDEKTSKVNPKNIKDILDETKNIRKSIDSLTKAVISQSVKGSTPAVAKLSDKASQKVADAMVKDFEKQNKGGGMSALVDAFNKLKDISLKDIIVGKIKLKQISKLFDKAKDNLNINEKDLNSIIKVVNISPEIINSLLKVNRKIDRIIKNGIISKLHDILFSKDSLLSLAQLLQKNEKIFDKANTSAKYLMDFASTLNKTFKKLFFASLWSKMISIKSIDGITTTLNKIIPLSKDLTKNKKDIESGSETKLGIFASLLNKTMRNLFFASIWGKKITNKELDTIEESVNKLSYLSKELTKNKKNIDTGAETKSLGVFASLLNKTMRNLFFASMWSKKITNKELDIIEESVNKLIPLSKLITKNKKDIDAGAETKSLGIFASLLNNTMRELFLTSIWAKKITNKEINAIEESVNKLIPLSKTITKSKKDIDTGAKAAKSINDLVSSLNKTMKKLFYVSLWTKIFSDKSIISIETTINKIISLSQIIAKNKKDIDTGAKAAKPINELVSSLNKAMRKLAFTSMWAKVASIGIDSIEKTVDKLIPLSKKLSKNKKDIENSKKTAKNITALVGNLLISSIFLTAAAVVGIPAILGAKVISKIIDIIVPAAKKLSRNSKHLGSAVASSLLFVAFTGIMGVASLALASIAVIGIPALIGSAVVMGVVAMNILTFKMLNKAKKNILIGSVMMALMGTSLILYGIALGKITKATENVTWKQVGIIAGTVVVLALATAAIGIPAVAACVALGSLVMPLMSFGIKIFASAIGEVSKATENLKMKQVLTFAGSLLAIGTPIAGLGVLSIPIGLGSLVLGTMSSSLYTFVKSLKIISDMGEVPTKTLNQVLNSMKVVRDFFIKNSLKYKVTKSAKRYKKLFEPLIKSTELLSKLNKIGSVPMKLVNQTLNAMKVIGDYYTNNPLSKKTIKQAKRYRDMMKPFSKTLKYFNKLTEMGSVPMKLVYQTLNAMKAIGEYYINNPIKKKAIKQAKRYRDMMKPFGKTLNYFDKLTKMGSVPIKLVQQTLNAMKAIGEYYVNNPIKKKVIKQAKRYRDMMKPFGKTLNYFDKLTKMGSVPMKLVYQTLNAMKTIGDYYLNNPIKRKAIKQAKRYRDMMKPFGKTLNFFGKLKEMGSIPMKLVYQTLNSMSAISKYYVDNPISTDAIIQANMYRRMMKPFGKTLEYFEKLKTFGSIPTKLIYQALNATQIIADFYLKQNAGISIGSNALMDTMVITNAVSSFGNTVQHLKELKNIPVIPIEALKSSITAIIDISKFYDNVVVSDSIDLKTKLTEIAVDRFTTMAKNIQDKFENIKAVNSIAVKSIVNACRYIVGFYSLKLNLPSKKKIKKIKYSVNKFSEIAKIIQDRFENAKEINIKGFESIINACNSIVDFYAFKLFFASEDKINQINHSVNKFTEIAKTVQSSFENIKEINRKGLKSIINTCKSIVDFYGYKFIFASEDKINQINYSVNKFTEISKTVQDSFANVKEINKKGLKSIIKTCESIVDFYGHKFIFASEDKINQINYSINKFTEISKTIQDSFENVKEINKKGLKSIIKTFKSIINFYGHKFIFTSEDKINQINYSVNKFTEIAKIIQDNFANAKEINIKGFKSIIDTCKSIVNLYGYKFILASEDKIKQINHSINEFSFIAKKVQDDFANVKEINIKSFKSIVDTCKHIVNFYGISLFIASEEKIKQINHSINAFSSIAKKVQDDFANVKEINIKGFESIIDTCKSIVNFYTFRPFFASDKKIKQMNYSINSFAKITKSIKDNIQGFTNNDYLSTTFAIKSMKEIVSFLDKNTLSDRQQRKARRNVSLLKTMADAMSSLSNFNPLNVSSVGEAFSNALSGISTVDLGEVQAVTNMFNAFNNINKSQNAINKFTESVKEFTDTCKNLMDAMNYNTDAINNLDTSAITKSHIIEHRGNNIIELGSNNNQNTNNGVCITNVDEIARTIAEKINGVLSVDMPDTQVQLLINGTGGNEWTISRY